MAITTATTPLITRPKSLLAPGVPALPNPDATAFVCDALAVVVAGTAVVVPLELLPTLVTGADPVVELVAKFVLGAAVDSGATNSKIEEVISSDDVMDGADTLLVEDAVVETAVLVGQVKREFEFVSMAMARKWVATSAPVNVVYAVTIEPLSADGPPVALHAMYVFPSIAHPRLTALARVH